MGDIGSPTHPLFHFSTFPCFKGSGEDFEWVGGAKDGKKRRGAKKKWKKWKGDEQKKRRGIPKK